MANNKHLSLSERFKIQNMLSNSYSFKAIAKELDRDCTTISKEVKKHLTIKKSGAYGKAFNNCIHRFTCNYSGVCDNPSCKHNYCRFCAKCSNECDDYVEYLCPSLSKPPYVCNGCLQLKKCALKKSLYVAAHAQTEYKTSLYESRSGIHSSEEEILRLNNLISPLIQKGQSIHHIYSNNRDSLMCSEKSIYNYIDYNLFSARNIDLPRKVRYRKRKKSSNKFKVDKSCRLGRTYNDFLVFIKEHPDTPVVEMDSVEGTKGGKVLLTLHFKDTQFMLAFIRDANTSRSVIDIFDDLYLLLSPSDFSTLFPVILTDNGSEFSNPKAIEFDKQGNRRTHIFYCDPSAPYQKGAAENNHEHIRRIVPKGCSFNTYTQKDITLMMNHINSYGRKKLNDRSPISAFSFFYGVGILKKLKVACITPNDIILKPQLLKK